MMLSFDFILGNLLQRSKFLQIGPISKKARKRNRRRKGISRVQDAKRSQNEESKRRRKPFNVIGVKCVAFQSNIS